MGSGNSILERYHVGRDDEVVTYMIAGSGDKTSSLLEVKNSEGLLRYICNFYYYMIVILAFGGLLKQCAKEDNPILMLYCCCFLELVLYIPLLRYMAGIIIHLWLFLPYLPE